ncbi:MAG: transglycosylase domain-containing protein, partial [Solirubrobacteraceae bacterium]
LWLIKGTIVRQPILSTHMPNWLREGTVAIEDHGFYQHGAVDYVSLVRAAFTDLASGRDLQGGSTITMQLVRNLYPAVGDAKTFTRKIKEAIVAERFERRHSKAWILTDYLNTVPYGTVDGQTAEGVQAASRMFFNHPASHDTLAESALLAGLPQAPTAYNPFLHPGAARQRRAEVLAAMASSNEITPSQEAAANAAPLGVVPNSFASSFRSSYFLDFIKRELVDRYGAGVLEAGDLKVYTTIDPHYGDLARQAINSVLNLPGDPSAALVSENPNNGYVDTIAQSGNYAQSEFSLATQGRRQPGSTFKAIVLADALAHGIDPFTTEYLSHTLEAGWLPGYPSYKVTIDGGGNLEAPFDLDQALVASDNTIFAQLAADLGESSVTQMAYAMGVVPGTLSSYPAEALGGLTRGVTPLEMANVYATLADGGWRNKQITIRKVVFPDGHVDSSWGVPQRVKVISTAAAAVETEILQHNVQYGTATASAITCPTAAKTGTTSGLVDAWLDGFTPNRATVVWMGYPNANISMTDVHGQAQFGGLLPAQIWHDYMTDVVTPPCAPLPDPAATPMTYVPFSGHYQQIGLASAPPANTGPSGPTGKHGKS